MVPCTSLSERSLYWPCFIYLNGEFQPAYTGYPDPETFWKGYQAETLYFRKTAGQKCGDLSFHKSPGQFQKNLICDLSGPGRKIQNRNADGQKGGRFRNSLCCFN